MKPIERILRAKREELERQKANESLEELRKRLGAAPPVSDFRSAIHAEDRLSLIAEIKRSSPSRGKIADVDVTELAHAYDESAAAAISVLTDPHFEGSIEHLAEVRSVTRKPILRKDFIVDTYQVCQARAYGADAVLLIASILDENALAELMAACREVGLSALVESHRREDLAGIPEEAEIYGINNRDLNSADLKIDMETTPGLLPFIPQSGTVVCESGILARDDIERIESFGRVNAVLVGTSIIDSGNPSAKIAELLGR